MKTGIVVPTLGRRPEFLEVCLNSIREAGDAYILLVGPGQKGLEKFVDDGFADYFLLERGTGLSLAINDGVNALPDTVKYINWLGDDDSLMPNSLLVTAIALEQNPSASFVYGGCHYVDERGKKIWTNKSGKWAVPLLRWGPDLIPQPGALLRRDSFDRVGQLNPKLGWAFDLDLFLKLSKVGRAIYLPETLASFRWHPDSLSVGMRKKSVSEASAVRKSHLPAWLRPISPLWEWPIMKVTLLAGIRVSKLAKSGVSK